MQDVEQQAPVSQPTYTGNHAVAAVFHILFKAAAVTMYLVGMLLINNYALVFVLTILFLAADFWTVKNVTGRLLVALRWWNEIGQTGENEWKFENGDPGQVNKCDKSLFWGSLSCNACFWLAMVVFAIFGGSLQWIPLALLGLILGGCNFVAYVKCAKADIRQGLKTAVMERPDLMAQAAMTVVKVTQ